MTYNQKQTEALAAVPDCVELEDMDGTWEHLVYRVEHPVIIRKEGEDLYTKQEAASCRKWLQKYAPESKYARVRP